MDALDRLQEVFPTVDGEVVAILLRECNNDVDMTTEKLLEISGQKVARTSPNILRQGYDSEWPSFNATAAQPLGKSTSTKKNQERKDARKGPENEWSQVRKRQDRMEDSRRQKPEKFWAMFSPPDSDGQGQQFLPPETAGERKPVLPVGRHHNSVHMPVAAGMRSTPGVHSRVGMGQNSGVQSGTERGTKSEARSGTYMPDMGFNLNQQAYMAAWLEGTHHNPPLNSLERGQRSYLPMQPPGMNMPPHPPMQGGSAPRQTMLQRPLMQGPNMPHLTMPHPPMQGPNMPYPPSMQGPNQSSENFNSYSMVPPPAPMHGSLYSHPLPNQEQYGYPVHGAKGTARDSKREWPVAMETDGRGSMVPPPGRSVSNDEGQRRKDKRSTRKMETAEHGPISKSPLFNSHSSGEVEKLGRQEVVEKKLVLLRGLPGSGKTTLARSLVGKNGVICCTDDFFVHNGEYLFDPSKLTENHEKNRNKAREAMVAGKSPVIIDNTNKSAWEMKPYVLFANESNYTVEILEPNTPWRFKTVELAKRNKHGVTRHALDKLLDRFEHRISLESILLSEPPSNKRESSGDSYYERGHPPSSSSSSGRQAPREGEPGRTGALNSSLDETRDSSSLQKVSSKHQDGKVTHIIDDKKGGGEVKAGTLSKPSGKGSAKARNPPHKKSSREEQLSEVVQGDDKMQSDDPSPTETLTKVKSTSKKDSSAKESGNLGENSSVAKGKGGKHRETPHDTTPHEGGDIGAYRDKEGVAVIGYNKKYPRKKVAPVYNKAPRFTREEPDVGVGRAKEERGVVRDDKGKRTDESSKFSKTVATTKDNKARSTGDEGTTDRGGSLANEKQVNRGEWPRSNSTEEAGEKKEKVDDLIFDQWDSSEEMESLGEDDYEEEEEEEGKEDEEVEDNTEVNGDKKKKVEDGGEKEKVEEVSEIEIKQEEVEGKEKLEVPDGGDLDKKNPVTLSAAALHILAHDRNTDPWRAGLPPRRPRQRKFSSKLENALTETQHDKYTREGQLDEQKFSLSNQKKLVTQIITEHKLMCELAEVEVNPVTNHDDVSVQTVLERSKVNGYHSYLPNEMVDMMFRDRPLLPALLVQPKIGTELKSSGMEKGTKTSGTGLDLGLGLNKESQLLKIFGTDAKKLESKNEDGKIGMESETKYKDSKSENQASNLYEEDPAIVHKVAIAGNGNRLTPSSTSDIVLIEDPCILKVSSVASRLIHPGNNPTPEVSSKSKSQKDPWNRDVYDPEDPLPKNIGVNLFPSAFPSAFSGVDEAISMSKGEMTTREDVVLPYFPSGTLNGSWGSGDGEIGPAGWDHDTFATSNGSTTSLENLKEGGVVGGWGQKLSSELNADLVNGSQSKVISVQEIEGSGSALDDMSQFRSKEDSNESFPLRSGSGMGNLSNKSTGSKTDLLAQEKMHLKTTPTTKQEDGDEVPCLLTSERLPWSSDTSGAYSSTPGPIEYSLNGNLHSADSASTIMHEVTTSASVPYHPSQSPIEFPPDDSTNQMEAEVEVWSHDGSDFMLTEESLSSQNDLEFLKGCFPLVEEAILQELLTKSDFNIEETVSIALYYSAMDLDSQLSPNSNQANFAYGFMAQVSNESNSSTSSGGNGANSTFSEQRGKDENISKDEEIARALQEKLDKEDEEAMSRDDGGVHYLEEEHDPTGEDCNLVLKLTSSLARQLQELFGSVESHLPLPGAINDKDLEILLSEKMARRLYQGWVHTLQAKKIEYQVKSDLLLSESLPPIKVQEASDGEGNTVSSKSDKKKKNKQKKKRKKFLTDPVIKSTRDERSSSPSTLKFSTAVKQNMPPVTVGQRKTSDETSRSPGPLRSLLLQLHQQFPKIRDVIVNRVLVDNKFDEASTIEQLNLIQSGKIPPPVVEPPSEIETGSQSRPATHPPLARPPTHRDYLRKHKARVEGKKLRPDEEEDDTKRSYQEIDYPSYSDMRAEAALHAKLRAESFQKAAHARSKKQYELAVYYAQQGHMYTAKMKEANDRAADYTLQYQNEGMRNRLDLHGLHVTEALEALKEKLNQTAAGTTLQVITGYGSHSKAGEAKIKPAVLSMLKNSGYKYEERNRGCLKVLVN